MEPLKNEPATNTVEQKSHSTVPKLEAISENPELIPKKQEAPPKAEIPKPSVANPITKTERQQRLYLGGIIASIIVSIVALFVSIDANHDRAPNQIALVEAFASALAKNSADKLQTSNVGVAQPSSMNNGQNPGPGNAQGMNTVGPNNAATNTGNVGPNPSGNNVSNNTDMNAPRSNQVNANRSGN